MRRRRSLPLPQLATLTALVAGIALAVPVAATDRVIVVRPGDTLSQIALEQGVALEQLVAWNGIADPDHILAGQELRVSEPAAHDAPAPAPAAAAPAPSGPQVHVVQSGENLTLIAERYGTTIAAIATANGIANPSYVQAGQRLTIPARSSAPAAQAAAPPATPAAAPPAPPPVIHSVAAGENLTFIAQRYGTTIGAIVAANGIADPSYLRVGQRLTIPNGTAPSVPARDMPATMRDAVAARSDIRAIIVDEANAQGVPVAFALAVAWQESGWRPSVVSSAGAVGVMQLTPPTADWVAATMLGTRIDLYDARSNVHAGVVLLRHYFDRYHGDKSLVLAAYYQGQTGADRHGVYAVTRPYIASVFALEAFFNR